MVAASGQRVCLSDRCRAGPDHGLFSYRSGELESIGISIFDPAYQIVVAVMVLNVSKKTHYAYAIKPKN